MNISDIIKKDSDRVFVVAPECYIIFTGDSLEDEFPFIRIGNSLDLPVEIIPFVKNIVVADRPVGNPLIEQCNIDLNSIPQNCYIGTNPFVKHFITTQELFELDMSSVTIIDAETDMPQELEKGDQSPIIGLFYTDGNFKIQKDESLLFSLDDALYTYYSDYHIQKMLAANKNQARYSQTGFVSGSNHMLLYRNGNFTSIGSSGLHINDFFSLQLDPSAIREIVQPFFSFQPIPLLKIQNNTQKSMRVFSDFTLNYTILGTYYKKSIQAVRQFMGMSHSTGDGIVIENIAESANMLVTFSQAAPANADVTMACLMDCAKYDLLLKETFDFMIVTEEVYMTIKPLLRSITVPLFLLGDKPNRKTHTDILQLFHTVQYDVKKYDNGQQLLEDICKAMHDKDLVALCSTELDLIKLKSLLIHRKKETGKSHLIDMLNLQAILRLLAKHTRDNKIAKKAFSLLRKLESRYNESLLHALHGVYYKGTITLHGSQIILYYHNLDIDHPVLPVSVTEKEIREYDIDSDIYSAFNRMLTDRERLRILLSIYAKTRKKQVRELKKAIKKREPFINEQNMRFDTKLVKSKIRKVRFKKFITFVIICALCIAAFFGGDYGWKYYQKQQALKTARLLQEEHRKQREYQKKRLAKLIKDYKIYVSGTDILQYTNRVALRNGYARITLRDVHKRNPNWIFPGNGLYLLDGEKIIVKKGDTMWAIAEKKLMQRHITFYTLIDSMKKKIANKESITKELIQAKKVAFSDRHFADLRKIKKN